jgi:hypothetical protein
LKSQRVKKTFSTPPEGEGVKKITISWGEANRTGRQFLIFLTFVIINII